MSPDARRMAPHAAAAARPAEPRRPELAHAIAIERHATLVAEKNRNRQENRELVTV